MNISQHVERAAKFFPDKPAVLFEGSALTYRDLNSRVDRLANALTANGIVRGQCVALYLPNIPAFAVCYLAAVRIGAIALSINAMYKSEELNYILNDSGTVLIATTGELLPNIPFAQCPTVKQALVCEGDPQGHPTLDAWIEKAASRRMLADMRPGTIPPCCSTPRAPQASPRARRCRMGTSSRTPGPRCTMQATPGTTA